MQMLRAFVVLTAGLLVSGCTVEDTEAPPLAGPSEFGLSITLAATPDQVPRDGSSQAVITATVRDASGRPVAGQRLSVFTDVGRVSQNAVVTDASGRATFAFVAPPPDAFGNSATITVVPVDTNAANAAARTVNVLLTGVSNRTVPAATFTFLPAAPQTNQPVTFDASATTDEGARCLDACTYSWDFGDGGTARGRIVTHTFTIARTHVVRLTVTDPAGATGTTTRSVTVAAVAPPTVTLTVSPNPPLEGQPATFTATATAASGHNIVLYTWAFGDGTTATTTSPTVTNTYENRGTFVASVTATDDVGQTASASLQFTITGAGVTASFTVSPSNPQVNDTVQFDASASTGSAGASIIEYRWDFGDGTTQTSSSPTTTHTFTAARTFIVRLTVTDSSGRTGTTTREVDVEEAEE